jgi:hypothetical protein
VRLTAALRNAATIVSRSSTDPVGWTNATAEIAADIIRQLALRPEPFSSALGASAPGYSSAPPLDDFWKEVRKGG